MTAQVFGLTAPLFIAAAGVFILSVVVWRSHANVDHNPAAEAGTDST